MSYKPQIYIPIDVEESEVYDSKEELKNEFNIIEEIDDNTFLTVDGSIVRIEKE